ncbi:MAG: hypothetical protein AAF545_00370 [Pseudomonadota bacterium]
MSVSSLIKQSPRNALYPVAAVCGLLMGALLLAGAWGHFAATWPVLNGEPQPVLRERLAIMLPGVILLVSGMINVAVCAVLWLGKRWSLQLAIAANLIAVGYFAYLFSRGVPGHPIGLFLGFTTSYLMLLTGLRLGLTWPATPQHQGVSP